MTTRRFVSPMVRAGRALGAAVVLTAAALAFPGCAGEPEVSEDPAKQDDGTGMKTCPVSNELITDTAAAIEVEYDGKAYLLCCVDCKPKWDADPKKYIAP